MIEQLMRIVFTERIAKAIEDDIKIGDDKFGAWLILAIVFGFYVEAISKISIWLFEFFTSFTQ